MTSTRKGRLYWVMGVIALVAIALVAWVLLHRKKAPPPKPQAVPVAVAQAKVQNVPVTIRELGMAQAWTSVTVYAQVSGILQKVDFTEGQQVKAGQVLAEIDPAPYRAALTQAQGALKRDQALLAGAKVDLTRYKTLVDQDSISRQTYDDQVAQVQQDAGTVLLDQGSVDTAEVNLRWTRIVSPVSGRAGVRMVDQGNLINAGNSGASASAITTSATGSSSASTSSSNSGIVIINQLEPIAVTFSVPQGAFQQLTDLSDGFRKPLATQALSQETGAVLGDGQLTIADNRVNPATGTVELKARFDNAGDRLWPGQFINVQLTLKTLPDAVTIPSAALNHGPKGPFVYVVGPDQKVANRPVKTSWTEGDTVVVSEGVMDGDTVVTDGQKTLDDGSLVKVNPPPGQDPSAKPAPNAAPNPAPQKSTS